MSLYLPVLSISYRPLEITKRYPLAISRGISYGSKNLFVFVSDGEHEGIGEAAPGAGFDDTLADLSASQLGDLFPEGKLPEMSVHDLWQQNRERGLIPPAMAAVDIALWDLKAKQAGIPLFSLLGLSNNIAPTSITIGLNLAEVTRERVPELLSTTGCQSLKIKLGSPIGLEYDRAHFEAARDAATPFNVKLRVDANGGWEVSDAIHMIGWLADQGVDYVEQPLKEGNEEGLKAVHDKSPLPIFVDESCRFSADIPKWADHVDGINLKLMKCGGITEALRIVATAKAHGLQTMIGCMGETSVSIAAGIALGSLFDHIDLDSHLNLSPDPATGLTLENGVVSAQCTPGHGASLAAKK